MKIYVFNWIFLYSYFLVGHVPQTFLKHCVDDKINLHAFDRNTDNPLELSSDGVKRHLKLKLGIDGIQKIFLSIKGSVRRKEHLDNMCKSAGLEPSGIPLASFTRFDIINHKKLFINII